MPASKSPFDIMRRHKIAEMSAALRAGKNGTSLLDDGENNIGNATQIDPQILPVGVNYTTVPQTLSNNSRILNLTATSSKAQSITVVMTASKVGGAPGSTGPLTGLIEFGNGTQFTRVEFDVPFGPYTSAFLLGDNDNDQPQDSGAVIQVPTGILRAYFRYDNAFITPEVQGYAFGGPDSPGPINPLSGPYSPNFVHPGPMRTKAFTAYFGRLWSQLYKTQYLYVGSVANPVSFYYGAPPVDPAYYCIPPFAKSVRLIRAPQTAAMTLTLLDPSSASAGSIVSKTYDVASGVAPVIPIEGNENLISLKSATASPGDQVYFVKLVYEIGF